MARGSLICLAEASPEELLTPLGRRVLVELRRAGDGGLEPGKLRMSGALRELRNLARLGLAVSLGGTLFYSRDTYDEMARSVLQDSEPGSSLTIGQAREKTGLSRKFLIPLLNRMEADGLVRREGDVRVVLRPPSAV